MYDYEISILFFFFLSLFALVICAMIAAIFVKFHTEKLKRCY